MAVLGVAIILRIILRSYVLGLGKKQSLDVRSHTTVALLLMLMAVGISLRQMYYPLHFSTYSLTLSRQQQIARRIQHLKIDHLNHVGWWQNPEMLFMTGLHSVEIGRVAQGEQFTLLLSPTMRDMAPGDYTKSQQECQKTIIEESGYVLCQGIKK
jgi:hypothetical protein